MAKTCANCIYKDRKWGDNPCRTCMESGSDNHENWTGIDEEETELKGKNKKECSTCKSDNSLENCLGCIEYGHWEPKGENK